MRKKDRTQIEERVKGMLLAGNKLPLTPVLDMQRTTDGTLVRFGSGIFLLRDDGSVCEKQDPFVPVFA